MNVICTDKNGNVIGRNKDGILDVEKVNDLDNNEANELIKQCLDYAKQSKGATEDTDNNADIEK